MGTPYVILASGQSNIAMTPSNTWSPASNAKKWNNDPGDGFSIGSAYGALSGSTTGIAESYASRIAAADPTKDVYLIKLAKNGMDLTHWLGGAFYNVGAGYPGKVSWNTGSYTTATQLSISTKDSFGIVRPFYAGLVQSGDIIQLRDGTFTWTYVATGGPISFGESTEAVIPVYFYTGYGTAPSGSIQVAIYPQYVPSTNDVVSAALTAAGASKIDIFLWWQGESDAQYNTRYELEFNAYAGWLSGQTWWTGDTKSIFCGHCPTSLNGLAHSSPFNSRMSSIASTYSGYYANLASLSPTVWSGNTVGYAVDPYHMTGAGYKVAGDYLFDSVYQPTTSSVFRVRNASNTGWITTTPSQVKIRNQSNTGWIASTSSNVKVRNTANTAWLNLW